MRGTHVADFRAGYTYIRSWDMAVAVAIAIGATSGRKQRVHRLPGGGWTYEAAA